MIKELGRANPNPYGLYDLAGNSGWVNVGLDHDTAAFAVESIRRWWRSMGQAVYPHAKRLLITADGGGGGNGSRVRLWKTELQKLADETGLVIGVWRLPPSTSKWNKIENRLFSFITQNWRGKPPPRCLVWVKRRTTRDIGFLGRRAVWKGVLIEG